MTGKGEWTEITSDFVGKGRVRERAARRREGRELGSTEGEFIVTQGSSFCRRKNKRKRWCGSVFFLRKSTWQTSWLCHDEKVRTKGTRATDWVIAMKKNASEIIGNPDEIEITTATNNKIFGIEIEIANRWLMRQFLKIPECLRNNGDRTLRNDRGLFLYVWRKNTLKMGVNSVVINGWSVQSAPERAKKDSPLPISFPFI